MVLPARTRRSARRAPRRALALEEQGTRPRVVALERARWCRDYEATGTARLWPWHEVLRDRGAGGTFRLPTL